MEVRSPSIRSVCDVGIEDPTLDRVAKRGPGTAEGEKELVSAGFEVDLEPAPSPVGELLGRHVDMSLLTVGHHCSLDTRQPTIRRDEEPPIPVGPGRRIVFVFPM